MNQSKHLQKRHVTTSILLALLVLGFLTVPISAGVFQTMGEPGSDEGVAIVNQTSDGYRIIANRYETDPFSHTIRVLQMDRSGAVIKCDTYSGTDWMVATDAMDTSDGGFVLIGYSPLVSNRSYIIKSDNNGAPEWARMIEAGTELFGTGIMQMNDGSFVASFVITNGSADEILVTGLDTTGQTSWSLRIFDGVLDYQSWALTPSMDNGFLVAGTLENGPGNEYSQLAVFKITSSGTIDWNRHVSFPGEHFVLGSVIQTPDGGYLVSGGMNSLPMKCLQVKFTNIGQLEWAHYFESTGDPAIFTDVKLTFNGDYIMTGWSFNEAENAIDILIAKVSATGDPLWARKAGIADRSAWEYSFDIEDSMTGGYLVAGTIHNPFGDPDETEIVLLATDPLGHIPDCELINTLNLTATDITSSVIVSQRTITQDSPGIINTNCTGSIMTNPSSIQSIVHCQSASDVPALGIPGIVVLLITLGLILRVKSG